MGAAIVRLLTVPATAFALLTFAVPGAAAGAVPADPAGVITTVAGGNGDPALGTSVAVSASCGITYRNGAVYFTEQGSGLVRRLDAPPGY